MNLPIKTSLTLSIALLALAACNRTGSVNGKTDADIKLTAYPERVYWGDTHLHTSNSVDAFAFGAKLGPEDALRFARGEEVTSTGGLKAKLDRPLDFLVIADHSGGLGATQALYDAPRLFLRDPTLRRWHDSMHEGPQGRLKVTAELIDLAGRNALPAALSDPEGQKKRTAKIWTTHSSIVERYNEPGKFSAFIGFEYTLMPRGDNLHRVVMFRDGKARTDTVLPYDPGQGDAPVSKLWDYMDAYQKATGGQVLAIPHNSNVSNGLMFEMVGPGGGPMTAAYARRRAAHEPLVEATQIKGDSEAHPFLSPNDEFADFGKAGWDIGNLTMQRATTPDMQAGNYVREALKRGLAIEARTGVNPYKFGLIGSTDSHTGLSTGDENNFFGKHSGVEPGPARASAPQNLGNTTGRFGWQYLAGGYAGVWARGNSRSAIFDAMLRKETYATTGPRMTVRFFGGWNYGGGRVAGRLGQGGLCGGRADGRRPERRGDRCERRPEVHRFRAQGPDRRQPRPHPDRQRLDRRGRQAARDNFQRRVEQPRNAQAGRRQAAAGRRYRRCRNRQLPEQHRRGAAGNGVDRSRIQRRTKGLLLRPRPRNPDAALGAVRRAALQGETVARHPAQGSGTRLYVADLVSPQGMTRDAR